MLNLPEGWTLAWKGEVRTNRNEKIFQVQLEHLYKNQVQWGSGEDLLSALQNAIAYIQGVHVPSPPAASDDGLFNKLMTLDIPKPDDE